MASNLLIFLRINWPQCVKSTAKFGGLATIWSGLCPPPPPAPARNRHWLIYRFAARGAITSSVCLQLRERGRAVGVRDWLEHAAREHDWRGVHGQGVESVLRLATQRHDPQVSRRRRELRTVRLTRTRSAQFTPPTPTRQICRVFLWNNATRPWRSCLGYRHAGCLQLSHRQPPEMCGLKTRPPTDVDPPR